MIEAQMKEPGDAGPRRRGGWWVAIAILAVLSLGLAMASCGSDSDDSPEQAFCDAGDSLDENIQALVDMDVAAEGTDALESQVEAIDSDFQELKDSGSEVAAEELDSLDEALSALDSAIAALGGEDLSADNVTDIVTAVQDTSSAAQATFAKLEETCG